MQTEMLVAKISQLTPARVSEVEDFIEFLVQREQSDKKRRRDKELAAYVAQWAGTEDDMDEDLEQASLEAWAASERENQ